jgi:hypothetical protein
MLRLRRIKWRRIPPFSYVTNAKHLPNQMETHSSIQPRGECEAKHLPNQMETHSSIQPRGECEAFAESNGDAFLHSTTWRMRSICRIKWRRIPPFDQETGWKSSSPFVEQEKGRGIRLRKPIRREQRNQFLLDQPIKI